MSDQKGDIILSIHGMSKPFGRNRVLDHIDLDLRRGSIMGLMGGNGTGKSTMMKCLFGTYQKDEGEIILDDHEVSFLGPKDALENRIAMIHQELNQCPGRSVVDNLLLECYSVNGTGIVGEARMKKEATELFRSPGMTVSLTQPVQNMSVSQRQMYEIVKAIFYHSKIIVLDEPTSPFTESGVRKLFTMMQKLQDRGISLIYISHKMNEIFEICGQVSVLRDSKLIMTKDISETNLDGLIAVMVGRSPENRFPLVDSTPGNDILSIQHLPTKFEPHIQDMTFNVHEGEIFGLYDLVGAGRTGLLEAIFDVHTRMAGRVYYDGEPANFDSVKETMKHGFTLITGERKVSGLFLKGNLTFSTTIASLKHYKNGPAFLDQKMVEATSKQPTAMHTKYVGPENLVSSLSGDNRQKAIFGEWFEREPNAFMMDEPTRDIDVDAKYEIYELITRIAKEDKTIIVVSSEMPRILGITSRIGVIPNGYLSDITETKEINQEGLLCLSAKYL